VIDLHTHSNFSDGSLTPTEIAERASALGISTIALTDHDSTASYEEMRQACETFDLDYITGTEISLIDPLFPRTSTSGSSRPRGVHVLAYFVDMHPDSSMQRILTDLRIDREQRNAALVEILRKNGFDRLDIETIAAKLPHPETLGRPHIVEAMFDLHPEIMGERNSENWARAFHDWLGTTGKAYIPKTELSLDDVVAKVAGSGTVFSVAHPLLNYLTDYTTSSIEREMPAIIRSLKDRGFVGVEAYYGSTPEPIRSLMVKLTRDAGMIPTGGSDFHGAFKPDVALGVGLTGDLHVPDHVADELREASSRAAA